MTYLLTVLLVASLRTATSPDLCLMDGTLTDIYEISQRRDNTHILNMLDLPMGDVSVAVPPQYRYVHYSMISAILVQILCSFYLLKALGIA
jgi:hypothetical protein